MNSEFCQWLELSGLSKKELARRVRTRAHHQGLRHVSTEASRIRGWLDGQQPAADVARVIAEVLSEECREPLTPAALGFTAVETKAGNRLIDLTGNVTYVADRIQSHAKSDLLVVGTQPSAQDGLITGNKLVQPLEEWLMSQPEQIRFVEPGRGRVTIEDCTDLEAVTQTFRQWDNRSGGGLRRSAVVGQLTDVAGLLNGPFDSPQVRRRLFDDVADLAQLAGWMSYDVGLHAVAQQYYALGLHLAKEAADRLQGARMLYCMARQLIEVRRADDALELLDLALYGSRRTTAPKVRTLLLGMRARAIANLPSPNTAECERSIDQARQTFADPTTGASDPEWAVFYDDAELAGVIGACYRDLALNDPEYAEDHAARAEAVTQDAISLRGDGYERSRVLDLNNLATAYILMGEPEQAARTATGALDLAGRVRSTRLASRFQGTVSLATQRFPKVSELQELQERVSLASTSAETMGRAS